MSYGFIYVLSNPTMPGIYKVGRTTRNPFSRMRELSGATSCATPFEMLGYFDCQDCADIERRIHKALSKYRVNPSREFFQVQVHFLQDQFIEYAEYEDGVVEADALGILCTRNEFIQEEEFT